MERFLVAPINLSLDQYELIMGTELVPLNDSFLHPNQGQRNRGAGGL